MIFYMLMLLLTQNCVVFTEKDPDLLKDYCSSDRLNKIIIVKNSRFTIEYSICDKLQKGDIQINSIAQLYEKNHHNNINLGDSYANVTPTVIKTINGDLCKENIPYSLSIQFDCHDEIQDIPQLLEPKNDCEFTVIMMNPNSCTPKCTTNINGMLIDLRNLAFNTFVKSTKQQFNVQLCGQNEKCPLGISSCEINAKNETAPLATIESGLVAYNDHELTVHGSYNRLKFKAILKCNWDVELSDVTYRDVSNQGVKYIFNMESKYACVKLPPKCELNEGWFTYDLKKLNRPSGWRVKHVDGSLILNVCGFLNNLSSKRCIETNSQVCDYSNNVNKGSLMSDLEFEENSLLMTISGGDICDQKTDFKYSSRITFLCASKEHGPEVIDAGNCMLNIKWKTPHACPQFKKDSCNQVSNKSYPCSFNVSGNVFNLSSLNIEGGFKVQNIGATEEYLLNICKPVLSSEAKCDKDSLALLKKLNVIDLKERVISIGRNTETSMKNGELVIEHNQGSLCSDFDYYKSIIYFKCSETEENPKLLFEDNCKLEFAWNSRHACVEHASCTIPTNQGNMYDLGFLEPKVIELNDGGYKTEIDLCSNSYSTCFKDECKKYDLLKKYITNNESNYIIINLNRKCQSPDDFDKIIFKIICDEEAFVSRFEENGVDQCVMNFTVKSNYVCTSTTVVSQDVNQPDVNYVPKKNSSLTGSQIGEHSTQCNISNSKTGYQFNLNTIKPNNIPFLAECPVSTINETSQSVYIQFRSFEECLLDNIKYNYSYLVDLRCSNMDQTLIVKHSICEEVMESQSIEACKLFNPHKVSVRTSNIIGAVIGGISIIVSIFVGIIYYMWRRKRHYVRYNDYLKDGEL